MTKHIDAKFVTSLYEGAKQAGILALVTGAAIEVNGGILVAVRSISDDEFSGLAELPGGGVETGESILDGLYREIREETGVEIEKVYAYLGHFDYTTRKGTQKRQFNFFVKPSTTQIALNPEEHSSYLIISSLEDARLKSLRMSEEVKALIQLSLNFMHDSGD